MAGTTSDKLALLRQIKESFRTAITGKGQTISDDEPFSSWPAKVEAIETGVQLPTLTNPGAAGDLRSGKQLIAQDGSTVNGSLAEVAQATPGISVSSSGLITASVTQSGGIVTAGTKSATKQLSSSDDADFIASNIKNGVSIFGVSGTMEPGYIAHESSASKTYGSDTYSIFWPFNEASTPARYSWFILTGTYTSGGFLKYGVFIPSYDSSGAITKWYALTIDCEGNGKFKEHTTAEIAVRISGSAMYLEMSATVIDFLDPNGYSVYFGWLSQ